jgi:hypothetical protein
VQVAKPFSLDGGVKAHGQRIFEEFRSLFSEEVGKLSRNRLTLLKGLSLDAAYLSAQAMAGEDVEDDRREINTQLANLFSAAQGDAVTTFWRGFWIVTKASVGFAALVV